MVISLQEEREKRQKAKEQMTCNEIQDDMNALWGTIDCISKLPYPLQVRLVSYCLVHFVSFKDVTSKDDGTL